jgi:hypothetical protein
MDLNFEPIQLDRQEAYLERLRQCSQISSDYSFSNLFGWSDEYGLSWAWRDEQVWIRQSKPELAYWAPVGPWQTVEWPALFEAKPAEGTTFIRVPEKLLALWRRSLGDRVLEEEQRDHWDYLYDIAELVDLKGNRFHKKKNLLNQFMNKYDYRYHPFSAEMIEPGMAMQADWCNWRDCESSDVLAAENRSVFKILTHWKDLSSLVGGVIMVEGMIVAYTLAEKLDDDSVVVHYEKGCPDYKGVYQAINQMFLANLDKRFKWVNREQDLGEPGLRKAKLSYHPAAFLKKYRVSIR